MAAAPGPSAATGDDPAASAALMTPPHSHFGHHDERYKGPENEMVAHDHLHPSFDPQAACSCAYARLTNGWCRHCNVGYIAGLQVNSARLFETMDPHGHVLDLDSMSCETCRQAIAESGFCDLCGMGYVEGKTYFTRLTYFLAQGKVVGPPGMSCPVCTGHLGGSGWCDDCKRGVVGNVAISDRRTFAMAAREFELLHSAKNRLPICELCSCAMMVHRTCPSCSISYESGVRPPVSNSISAEAPR